MDELQRTIAQAPAPGPDPLLTALLDLGRQIGANNTKVDALTTSVADIKTSVTTLDGKIEEVKVNLNGDGSPEHRGWVGMIQDLRTMVEKHTGFWAQMKQWGNVPVTVALTIGTTFLLQRFFPPSPPAAPAPAPTHQAKH